MLPTHHPDLPFYRPNWQGNPLDEKGLYRNLYQKSERSYRELFRWQFGPRPQKVEKKADLWQIVVRTNEEFSHSTGDAMLWLGHTTYLIRVAGKTIITDPIFGKCGPIPRRSALPFPKERIPQVDYILLSHNHRDHADKPSMQYIAAQNPQAPILTGLSMERLLQKWGIKNPIQAAGWWQTYQTEAPWKITYLPAMHWARRGPFDLNDMLWGSFLIETPLKTLFFGADSGYGPHYKDIAEFIPQPDYAMLGIGAYQPDWFMHTAHTNPEEAWQAALDLGAKTMIPMHYGTFDLSDEPFGEPYRRIKALADQEATIQILEIGEMIGLG